MATADDYAQWIVNNAGKKGTPEFDTVAKAYAEAKGEPATPAKPLVSGGQVDIRGDAMNKVDGYSSRDILSGALRGAGSIGATLLAPRDALEGYIARKMGAPELQPQDRRSAMDAALAQTGADTSAIPFQMGKLGTEIAGTAGAGSAVANAVSRIPGASTALPNLLPAIRSGGMTTGGAKGAYGMANRVAGGAVSGAATAGAVNPDDADEGMMLGGGFPLAIKAAGATGNAIGNALGGAPKGPNPTALQTARESIDAGYIIPPNMVRPSFKNQVIESISGKQATQQIASMKNTEVTESLVRKALGIADDVPLTQSTMENLRKTAGKTYAEVSNLSPQAATDLEALKVARNEATGWFQAYNRSARPDDLVKAKTARALSDSLETALEGHAKAAGRDSLIPALRNARKEIAKTYTVGRALNDASGTVDARILGRMYEKGLPLSDGLDVAGKFASAFPTVAKAPQQIGSPAAHNLKSIASMAMGGGGFAALGPMGAAAAAVPFVAPPIARSMMFSNRAQQGLLNVPQGRGLLGLALDESLPLMYRTNPLAGGLIGGQ